MTWDCQCTGTTANKIFTPPMFLIFASGITLITPVLCDGAETNVMRTRAVGARRVLLAFILRLFRVRATLKPTRSCEFFWALPPIPEEMTYDTLWNYDSSYNNDALMHISETSRKIHYQLSLNNKKTLFCFNKLLNIPIWNKIKERMVQGGGTNFWQHRYFPMNTNPDMRETTCQVLGRKQRAKGSKNKYWAEGDEFWCF